MSVRTESLGHEGRRVPFTTLIAAVLAFAIGIGLGAVLSNDDAGSNTGSRTTYVTRDTAPDPAAERTQMRIRLANARGEILRDRGGAAPDSLQGETGGVDREPLRMAFLGHQARGD